MSYYDFDYFWTHEEIGGKKLPVSQQPSKIDFLKKIWRIITNNQDNSTESRENHPKNPDEKSLPEISTKIL